MLKSKMKLRKIRNILIILLTIIMILGIGISASNASSVTGIGLDSGTINPIYKPEWTKVSSSLNTTNKTLTITVKGSAYESQTINSNVSIDYASDVSSTLVKEDITVFINGVEVTSTTNPTVTVSTGTESTNETSNKKEITHNIVLSNLEEAARRANLPYKELSGNIKIKIAGRGKDQSTYAENVLTDDYGNQSMMETDQNGTNADGTWIDVTFEDPETNKNTNGTMFADFVKPEFTYISSETNVNQDSKTLTVIFYAVDQYFDSANSSLALSDLTLVVDGQTVDINVAGNTLTADTEPVKDDDGNEIGTKYTLIVKNLQKNQENDNDGFSYSGIVSIGIPANKFKDLSGNANDATVITVGVDENDGNVNTEVDENGTIVDIVDPVWKVENIEINENLTDLSNSTVTLDLIATDKYYLSNTIETDTANKILVYVDGVLDGDTDGDGVIGSGETSIIQKTLSTPTNLTPTGTGVKYTLTLNNWDAEKYSGTTKIVIVEDTITDQYTNTSIEQEFTIGHIDFVKPVIEKVSSSKDATTKTQTIVFKATDKHMDTTDLITIPDETNPSATDEITVYIDDEEATGITRTLTITSKIVRNKTTGTVTNQETDYTLAENESVIGHEYTLVLSDLEQTRTEINRSREFSDWSGTVEIEIAEGAVKDIQVTNSNGEVAGGNTNVLTTLEGDFVDFIKPNVTYEYSSTDIVRNHEDKTQRKFTMVFDVTDKYFTESAFATALANATTDATKLAVLQEYLTIWVDGVDVTNVDTVTKKIVGVENVTATTNKTVSGNIVTGGTYTIGKRFTLEISNLEQEYDTAIGNDYLDYSGVITVAFNENKPIAKDETANVNNSGTITAPSITSGVTTPDGSGTGVIVDLVDPIWEIAGTVEARPHDQYAKLPIKGTDKYIVTNNLQPSDITIVVTSPSGVVTVTGDQASTQGMELTVTQDTSVTLDYGKQYNVELTGYTSDAYQVKLIFRDGILVDESGNTSQEESFVLFSSLVETSTETEVTSEFLALNKESGQTIPQRQYIEQVIFQDDLIGINDTKWDVSQLNDETIWAWYTTRIADDGTTLYTVYIGSYIIINGNVNSSYLFANIGRDANCNVTGDTTDNEMIENIYLLHTSSVTNMSHMFEGCGYANMQSLDLGAEFDTRLATNMESMFKNCGYTSMTTFDLGEKFDTSNVTNMINMFNGCGQNAMTTFNVGATTNTVDLNTILVQNMSGMFQNFGHKLSSLTLGTNFTTNAVTNMSNMFNGTGKESMATLNLGSNFNTVKVTDMSGMFQDFATNSSTMTTLDLGDLFYTTSATNMSNMFNGCGTTALTTFDLGPAFTIIADTNTNFATNLGNAGTTIYAPESIYSSLKNFKLNTTSSTTISLDATTQGTINPVYRPEWTKVSSNLDTGTGVMTVVVKGLANKVGTPISQINYLSDVTSTLTNNDVTIYIDGELADDVTVAVSTATSSANETTQKTEVQHTITISNFEKLIRKGTKNFKEWSGNIALQFAKGTLKDMYGSSLDASGNLVNIAGNSNLATIDIDAAGTMQKILVEEASKLSANTTSGDANLFTDVIKPEFTYEYANTAIDYAKDKKTVTVVFDVTDKYFNSTDLSTDTNADLIKVLVDGELPGDSNGDGSIGTDETLAITKALAKKTIDADVTDETTGITYKSNGDIYYTVNGTSKKVGERYQLVISGLQQNSNDSFDYSGIVTLQFGDSIIDDLSGNENDAMAITIGVDEPETDDGHDSEIVVDVVDPIWRVQNLNTTTSSGITTATMDLIATDKFFKESTLELNDVQVIVAGVNIAATDEEGNLTIAPELQRTLSEPVYISWDNETETYTTDGITEENANGQKYTFTVSGLEETYEAFYEKRAEYAVDSSTGRLYREYSGPTSIVIPAGTITDQSNNQNIDFTIDGIGHIDTLKPEVIKVSSTAQKNADNVELSKHIIVFDIVDKYLDTSSITTTDTSMIHVYLDGELTEIDTNADGVVDTDTVTKTITNIEQLNATVNGTTQKIGYRYTLELSSFENARTSINYNREYTDWSGDLTVKIDANVAYDLNPTDSSRRGNVETILSGNEENTSNLDYADFVDYIKPDATYESSASEVTEDDEDGKTFEMTFDITDKFYYTEDVNANGVLDEGEDTNSNGVIDDGNDLSVSDIQILLSAENETEEGEDGYIDLTSNARVGKSLRSENITNVVNGQTVIIGKRYTLVLTNLEQVQKVEGNYYLDYSGVITIFIPESKVTDTSGNGNDLTAITSGINIPGGEISDISAIDIVAPIWERTEFTTDIHNKTATIKLLGTDKYFFDYEKDGDLTSSDDDVYGSLEESELKLLVNGLETTGNITITQGDKLYEERIVLSEYGDGDVDTDPEPTTENVQYGIEYTITIEDLPINVNQVKIHLTEGSLVDKSNNASRATEFLVYNTLISAENETEATSVFLSEIAPEGGTTIARQDIQRVVFVNNIEGSTADGVKNVWDVSAQRDNSIIAWYSETAAPYTVYIGSNDDIYGNVNSSYLFAYIGASNACISTEAITSLSLLKTSNVTNMTAMFWYCGAQSMTSLNLGAFDTTNATNMKEMFSGCGFNNMTTFNLGTKFNTNNVTDMSWMFANLGYTRLGSLTLPDTFNTTNVIYMNSMFENTGNKLMGSLSLGANFDTANVTDMSNMFNGTGQDLMTTFSLGSNFNTVKVQNMSGMFKNFANNLQTLSLGNSFNTSIVTDMSEMFNGAGKSAMQTLTLGDNFNTSAVQNMNSMFKDFATNSTVMTSLDLREKFYTTAANDMTDMFNGCGTTAMTSLDLGPAFTKIPTTNTGFVTNCGKSEAIIYAPESIYSDMKHFRLNTDSTTTIEYTQGTINPKYKPQWLKVSSSLTIEEQENLEDSVMTIVVKGNVDTTVYENAIQTITSAITAGNDTSNLINIYVDGEIANGITKTIVVDSVTETEVQYTITLSNFPETTRQDANGKNFLEWAGNVALQFTRGTLVDAYGNKNMAEIDVNSADLTQKERIEIADETSLEANVETDKMFADYVKPEFTYEYYNTVVEGDTNANTVIDYENNIVTIVFDVTDKYFDSTTLATDTEGDNITVRVSEDVNADTAISKSLTKKTLAEDVVEGNITYKANGDIYFTVNGTSKKIGERYQLVITGLESANGVGYSGPMTLTFPEGTITDKSGNESVSTLITIGIDAPENHPEHDEAVIVDVVNPIWVGLRDVNSIERADTNSDSIDDDVVSIKILGIDKYYKTNTLSTDDITIYVDLDGDGTIEDTEILDLDPDTDMALETIETSELLTLAEDTELANYDDVKVGYTLTLTGFGDVSGKTKIMIADNTIEDQSGNLNENTDLIFAGNIIWEESNEPLESTDDDYPRYTAFRNDIVDFIDPVINYTYSEVKVDTDGDGDIDEDDSYVSANPDINYSTKQVTIKFTVTDKYLLESDLIQTVDGNQIPKNISIKVDQTDVTSQVTTSISETAITGGKEYTLVISNLQQNPNTGIDISGPMQLIFAEGAINDTSGNTNPATVISLETHVEDEVVDVVDPIIPTTETGLSIRNESNSINRENKTVTVVIQGTDKYLSAGKLLTEEFNNKIKVRIKEHDGDIIEDASATNLKITKADGTVLDGSNTDDAEIIKQQYPDDIRVTKVITQSEMTSTTITYEIVLNNFGQTDSDDVFNGIFEGEVTLVIPEDSVIDTSGNGNLETSVLVGNSADTTAFKDSIVEFEKPTWNYATSSITRDRNDVASDDTDYVTIKIIGHDNYYTSNSLTEDKIDVLIADTLNADIDKDLQAITDTTELTNLATQAGLEDKIEGRTITDVVVGYTLTLKAFGINEDKVDIVIDPNTILDTSGNGNSETTIAVGNPAGVEDNEPLETTDANYPAFDGFRNSIVDYIKPVITLESAVLDRDTNNGTVTIIFDGTDRNYTTLAKLATNVIGEEDIQIFVDTGSNERDVTNSITKSLTRSTEMITKTVDGKDVSGYRYTLVLSGFDKGTLDDDIFKSHSGVIKLVIAADQIFDTSGNKNNVTTLIANSFQDDAETIGVADFIKPIIHYQDTYLNWQDRYALITLRATDRFFDTDTELKLVDENGNSLIKFYEETTDGSVIDITNELASNLTITESPALTDADGNIVGYDYTIRINNFEEEFKMKIQIPEGMIGDTSGNYNDGYTIADGTAIEVNLDNRRPVWNYVSTDTSNFEDDEDDEDEEGIISFTVKGEDKFLKLEDSNLQFSESQKDIKILKDGVDITSTVEITVNYLGTNDPDIEADLNTYKKYQIDVTGLTEMGTYTLVIAKNTLVDKFSNYSAETTITFSNSETASNTDNYVNVTYHVTPDMETLHKSFVHELLNVTTTGINTGAESYRPSSLGELFNNSENPLFKEPIKVPVVNGYIKTEVYAPKSFAGWAEADEDGNTITGGTVYGLYDDIPKTVTNLKAVWQDATIVFVSATNGDDSRDGELPDTSVKNLSRAYELLSDSKTAEANIIIIMDEVVYNNSEDEGLLNKDATITSIYGGYNYKAEGAELKISSDMTVDGEIIFDNIKLYVSSTDNKLISNYSGDITLGRGVETPSSNYTFGTIIGGNLSEETSTGELGTHTVRVETGKYNNIVAGSLLTTGVATSSTKSITHNVVIGNMRDATVSRNDKLTITGYVAVGENEKQCYPTGVTSTYNATNKNYASVTLYSGTITSTDTAIYLRSINGETDGIMNFEMFGGIVTGNIYGGSRVSSSDEDIVFNTMKFYGGQLTGEIFGQGLDDTFTGSSSITLQGIFSMQGNVFGGSHRTATTSTSVGKGDSTILINSGSVTVDGNIYGGGNITEESTGYITGDTNITLRLGTVSNIYGSGYNCGNQGITNIIIEQSGIVIGNIFGGAYKNQARQTSNITVLGGTIQGNIYGGNNNIESQLEGDTFFQDVKIIIGNTEDETTPTINGIIYGGGKYDKVDVATIELIEASNVTSVFGGSDIKSLTTTANIYLKGMTLNEIYGGSDSTGADDITVSVANIYLQSGTVTDVYGGGYESKSTQTNVVLEGSATVTNIYGGSSTSGTVTTSRVTLKSGTVTNVFGGGYKASVGTANVILEGLVDNNLTIHGGSRESGLTTTSNVTLKSGTVKNVFGGGLDVGVTTANINHKEGATVTNIYGGNDSIGTESATGGDTGTTNINILNSTVENVYGGNYLKGTTRYTNIDIHGTSTVTGNIFGGGYKSNIGNESEAGTTTINIVGGTVQGDINGGSEQGIVYGATTINVGFDAAGDASLTPGAIDLVGDGMIYGAGSTVTSGEVTVNGNTYITLDNGTSYPITYSTATGKEKSIYGSGQGGGKYSNGTTTDASTIHLKDFGTASEIYLFRSIEDTGSLYIGNSIIELTGALDSADTEVGQYYTLNTITNLLTIYNNTTLYTQRGFNKVGGFNSYVNKTSTKQTVTITDGIATTNVDNKLYTLEGVNLIFAKEEVTLTNKSSLARANWGEVTGMAYFGMYKNTLSGKQYDLDLFRAGTYVEAQYNSYHNVEADGFYTTVVDETTNTEIQQIINTTNYTNYCDWIINAPTIDYDIDLVASTYGHHSTAEVLLDYVYESDYTYKAETVYTLNQVSSNALKPDIELLDPTIPNNIPMIASTVTNANNKFGLTMETATSGWKEQASTKIYSASNGSYEGDTEYKSDAQGTPGAIKFKLYNSLNITEEKDLGLVTIMLTGQQPISTAGAEAYTFNVVIRVNLQTIIDELKEQYIPSFTDRIETELNYATDSRIDLSYLLYKDMENSPFTTDDSNNITDYRVLSTTTKLPAGTRITMKDYGQGGVTNKYYYYHVTGSETEQDGTRYLYRLSNFLDMGSSDSTYADVESSNSYYNSTDKYVLEKYDISIDFIDANIDEDRLAQETYLELRNADSTVKYNNGDKVIKYNLKAEESAIPTLEIDTELTSYSVVESIDIPIDISGSILEYVDETTGIKTLDTKYYDKIAGVAIQIVGENNIRIKSPELQNFKLTNTTSGESYSADSTGVIRMPIFEALGSNADSYTLSITQANVTPGLYTAQVFLYTADDGKYYGSETETEPLEFNITFISRLAGLLGVETEDESSRIISKSTGLNLVENSQASKAIDMTIGIANPTNETNIRVELYKRNNTFTNLTDESTYTGTSYTLVDIKDYLQGTWTESVSGSKEYIVSDKKTYTEEVLFETIEFEKAIVEGISTGEYKLVFKAYSDDTLLQTFSKTFIVIP